MSSKQDKFAALRAARAGGSRLKQYKAEDAEIYDEVTEEQYKSIVGGRLARDDFIEDDDGSGYVDNGMDVWEKTRDESDAESDEEERGNIKRLSKKKTTKTAKPRLPPPSKPSAYRPQVSADKEDDFMSSLLSGVDSSVTRIPSSSPSRGGNRRKRKPSLDDAYDSGSITQPSSDGFDMPNSQLLFRGARSNGQEEDNGEDIGLWEMRNTDSIKKPRLVVKSEAEDTPKNGRRGVSFAESTADDSFTMDFDDNTNGETKAIDVDDDDEDFLVRSDRAIEAKANSSKARDRLMAAIGVKKETESTPKTSAMKNRRTMVNGSAISTKVEAQAQARAKAEELATEIQNQDLPQIVNKGKTERQNWLKLQETLNTGKLEDEASLGNPFNATAAAQKKYIPTLRVDAFEPLEGDAESEMDVDSDGEHSDSSIKARQNRRESKKKAQSEDSTADRTLRFFWIDYLEENGLVHLLGKAYDRSTEKYVSCCVTVKNIQRNLFVLPRERRVDADDYETDAEVSVMDVHQEFDALRRKHGVEGGFGMKKVTRKYAFEQREVPQGESDWYKVIYGFDQPQLPGDLSGATFSKIFGSNTSAFEILVLKRKIMGPCWLEVKGCVAVTQKPATWCRLEVRVDNPKDVNSFSEADANAPKEMPPITVMSINARTIINHNMNSQEILAVTTAIWEGYNIDDPTPVEKLRHVPQTIVRPLGEKFPPNFEVRAPGQQIKTVRTERELLNLTLIQIQRADPDVIVGHEFLGTVLEILLTRMKELKADHWSRIGRIRRTQLRIGKQGFTNAKYLAGRLVADLSSEGAKSTIDSVTWSLTEMCGTQLGFTREEIDPDDTAGYFDGYAVSPDRLLHFIRHLQMDAFAQMAITAKVQLLPLTKQLTNLAGNSWNRTLTGARAQRNEYILLHEFHRLKYICPDKSEGKPSSRAAKKINLDEDGKPIVEAKKNKYQGGLVFEPKRGLWDTYVMVMDFNSLYPSIIQEYNIDFTTVERDADAGEDDIPDIPSSDIPQGVLPRLIATLVGRRKQVKSLMKDSSNSPVKMMQYDIKQKALKLTANSMYGCLGFAGSRFYARPLAALTTFKGRETLTQTKEVAEGLSLDVVYGDTDSVFVNSNVTTYPEALKIANEFKKHVNDRYKLLEIDLDAVFSRVLLLQKKKYAAVKVSEDGTSKTEIKGLDMVRREYCRLSKAASGRVLDEILSGKATEDAITEIHEYLTSVGNDLRDGKIDLDDLVVFKRLGKNPEDYPDKKNQPHVQVALRMKQRGSVARAGEVIPYIFCLGSDGSSAKSAQADRAYHPDEFRRKDSGLKIDFEFYLSQQVLPPVERLCDEIEGTDRSRLAECLGLDPARFQKNTAVTTHDKEFFTFQSQLTDEQKYKDCDQLLLRCRACTSEFILLPLLEDSTSAGLITNEGVTCACGHVLSRASLAVQVENEIRSHVSRYYKNVMTCSECDASTRMMSVYGRRCISKPGCRGEMRPEYSDLQLYNQLMYYAYIFDVERAMDTVKGTSRAEQINALALYNREVFMEVKSVADAYLTKNGRRYVNMESLFGFMARMTV